MVRDPVRFPPTLTIRPLANGECEIGAESVPGFSYWLESSMSPTEEFTGDPAGAVLATGHFQTWISRVASVRFFRVGKH